jgi:hypothetical protein
MHARGEKRWNLMHPSEDFKKIWSEKYNKTQKEDP